VEAVLAAGEDQRRCPDRAASSRQVERVLRLDRRRHVGQVVPAREQARTGEPRERSGADLPSPGRHESGHHHGQGLPVRAAPDPGGHAALQGPPLRPQPAGGAEQHEATDDVGVVGGQLLGDAAAGRDPRDIDRPDAQRADRLRVLGASSAIDIPRGSPLLRLTNMTRRRLANGSSSEAFIRSVPAASTPVSEASRR
jgi:hypothetical protein